MAAIVQDLESDFRKIGYTLPDPRLSIALADTGHIKFYSDLYRTGTIDSVEWFTGPVLTTLPNPNIRVLFRKFNGDDALGAAGLGVTQFYLRYFNAKGTPFILSMLSTTARSGQSRSHCAWRVRIRFRMR